MGWAAVFAVAHGYWYLGGRAGLGDARHALPDAPDSVAGWMFTGSVGLIFFVGLAVPAMLVWKLLPGVPRGVLVAAMWAGCVVLLTRGGLGLLDDLLRDLSIADGGLTGLSYLQTLGVQHPSSYTLASTAAIDGYFMIGGIAFGQAARHHGQSHHMSHNAHSEFDRVQSRIAGNSWDGRDAAPGAASGARASRM